MTVIRLRSRAKNFSSLISKQKHICLLHFNFTPSDQNYLIYLNKLLSKKYTSINVFFYFTSKNIKKSELFQRKLNT